MIEQGSYVRVRTKGASSFDGHVGFIREQFEEEGMAVQVDLASGTNMIWFHVTELIEITEREFLIEQARLALGIDREGGGG